MSISPTRILRIYFETLQKYQNRERETENAWRRGGKEGREKGEERGGMRWRVVYYFSPLASHFHVISHLDS